MAVKVAVIGLGIMGKRMLEQMQIHADFVPVSLWDPSKEACRASQVLVPTAKVASSAEAAMSAADLVYLACPPVPRMAYAMMAADMGKAIFLEKPLGVDVAESRALVRHLEVAGVPAAVNFTQAAGVALKGVVDSAARGELGEVLGVDIIVTYAQWPRGWQMSADWLRYRAEGGMTREVLSHFLFFCERVLGPLRVTWAHARYPADTSLCETHVLAQLESDVGQVVSVMASVGGVQPDRQELTIKGSLVSRRISEFHIDAQSDGGPFVELGTRPDDPRAVSLRAQLNELLLCLDRKPNRLASPAEALRVQCLVEEMLET